MQGWALSEIFCNMATNIYWGNIAAGWPDVGELLTCSVVMSWYCLCYCDILMQWFCYCHIFIAVFSLQYCYCNIVTKKLATPIKGFSWPDVGDLLAGVTFMFWYWLCCCDILIIAILVLQYWYCVIGVAILVLRYWYCNIGIAILLPKHWPPLLQLPRRWRVAGMRHRLQRPRFPVCCPGSVRHLYINTQPN